MTNWLPDLSSGGGPLYQRLAERIEMDIDSGRLPVGEKLPPQRDLAYDIGTTVGTVGRAYSLLRERGLVSGEVGRGTYILPRRAGDIPVYSPDPALPASGTRPVEAPPDKIRLDSTGAPDVGQSATIAEAMAGVARDHPEMLSNYSRVFPESWFEAGSQWLSRGSHRAAHESIVPTLGVHAGVISAMTALTAPGDLIIFENITYSQVSRGAALAGRRPVLVSSDAQGVDPDDFGRICAQKHPKMAFLMPTAHNPTAISMPLERRRAIADIAQAHNVMLIEDDLYGHMSDDPTPLLAELAPAHTILVGGFSKSVAAGIRGGWLSCPPAYRHRIRVAHKLVAGGLPFLLAELNARLVLSGQAAAIRTRAISEINLRLEMARNILAGYDYNAAPNVPFIWLSLPDPWLSGTFKAAADKAGVLIDDEDEFKAGRMDGSVHRVRFGLSQPPRAEVELGLTILRRLLDEGPAGYAGAE